MALKLLVDPRAQGAFFAETLAVAQAEVASGWPGAVTSLDARSTLRFLSVDLPESEAPRLLRRATVQAVFEEGPDGLSVVEASPGYTLPPGLVWGTKYRGKTHELVTQLAINLALDACSAGPPRTLLDPMAGRGTTLLWGARYGLDCLGVEVDDKARDDFQRAVKRQTKVLRIKHRLEKGSLGPKRRDHAGRFLSFRFEAGSATLATGDTRHLDKRIGPRQFDVLVTDLPYGVQFGGSKKRSPLDTLRAAAPLWAGALSPGGAMAVVFNRLQPAREQLVALFVEQGLEEIPHPVAHRMSESIWRDIVVLSKPLDA